MTVYEKISAAVTKAILQQLPAVCDCFGFSAFLHFVAWILVNKRVYKCLGNA
jgi:hypothetical protein